MKKVYREAFQVIRHATEKSQVYFVAVILKVLLVNLLAALNFANVFLKIKKRLENEKNVKNIKKNRDQNKKRKKVFFTSMQHVVLETGLDRNDGLQIRV